MRIEDKIPLHEKERRILKYGDQAILNRLITSKNWKLLFTKKGFPKAVAEFTASTLLLLMAGLANFSGVFLRYKHGPQSFGFILLAIMLNFLFLFNTQVINDFLKMFVFWSGPIWLFFQSTTTVTDVLLVNVHSSALTVLTLTYAALLLVHLILIYLGKGFTQDHGKRGVSYIYRFFFKYNRRVSEYTIQGLFEPLLITLLGLLSYYLNDLPLAIILWLSAGSMTLQELLDHGLHMTLKPPD